MVVALFFADEVESVGDEGRLGVQLGLSLLIILSGTVHQSL